MPLKIAYVLTRRVLGLVVLLFRGDPAKDAALLVLRHANVVLRRQAGRVRYEPADRVWFAALARLIPRRRWTEAFPVTPATFLAWQRKLAGNKYHMSKRRKPGRPPTAPGIVEHPGFRAHLVLCGQLRRVGCCCGEVIGPEPVPARAGGLTWGGGP